MKLLMTYMALSLVTIILFGTRLAGAAPSAKPVPAALTPAGEKLQAEYAAMLKELRTKIAQAAPAVDPAQKELFMKAYYHEGPKKGVQGKQADRPKPLRWPGEGNYASFYHERDTLKQARPLLKQLDGFLGSDALDRALVKCTVLANATPRGLAAYAQRGTKEKTIVNSMLASHDLMKLMIIAGGAKAGRYWQSVEILQDIRKTTKQPNRGILGRLAIATALELAAPELCQYEDIDPVKRYMAYEKWYLAKQLDPEFENMSIWECRHIINDRASEEDLEWLRTMLRNYRPDCIATKIDRDRYTAIFGQMPHKGPEWDEDITRMQATLCNGGRCGPQAFFGRALTRSFGIPTWGARVKSHTAMTHWTPKGWTTALGVGWTGSYWTNDKPDNMYSSLFRLDLMAREHAAEYLKAVRAGMMGDALGEEKINGMQAGTAGFWHAIALNKKRAIVTDANPDFKHEYNHPVWAADTYPKRKDGRKGFLLTANIQPKDREISVNTEGVVTVPAAACVTPAKNTDKILFMESNQGGIQLHYRRRNAAEPFVYEVEVPKAGLYQLSAKVATVNRDQSFQLTVNGAAEPTKVSLPFTIGMWGDSKPVTIKLAKGKNTLSFSRNLPKDYVKTFWQRSGPDYGGITLRSLTLTPSATL